jgi:hypothetical protein
VHFGGLRKALKTVCVLGIGIEVAQIDLALHIYTASPHCSLFYSEHSRFSIRKSDTAVNVIQVYVFGDELGRTLCHQTSFLMASLGSGICGKNLKEAILANG